VRETIPWNVEAAFLNVRTPLENQEPADRISRQFTMMISFNLTGVHADGGLTMAGECLSDSRAMIVVD
jgi:hypothetical protein